MGDGPFGQRPGTKSSRRPTDRPRINRSSTGRFVPLSVYIGIRLVVLPKSRPSVYIGIILLVLPANRPGQLSSIP